MEKISTLIINQNHTPRNSKQQRVQKKTTLQSQTEDKHTETARCSSRFDKGQLRFQPVTVIFKCYQDSRCQTHSTSAEWTIELCGNTVTVALVWV